MRLIMFGISSPKTMRGVDSPDVFELVTGPAAEGAENAGATGAAGACAAVQRYGDEDHSSRAVLDMLLRYAISEDGALHAEKYYRTTSEEFASLRPAFRWRQLVALARVTASEFGRAAPGYADACGLLKL